MNITALFYFQLLGQLRRKHPERFDLPAAEGKPPRESESDSDQEQTTSPTGTQIEEPASTASQRTTISASRKRKPAILLEKIEKRLAANQQQTAQIAQQVKNYFDET